MAITCYNIVADCYVNRSGNKQKEVTGPTWEALFILFSPQTNFSLWPLRSPACSDLLAKVTLESYIEKLHAKVT